MVRLSPSLCLILLLCSVTLYTGSSAAVAKPKSQMFPGRTALHQYSKGGNCMDDCYNQAYDCISTGGYKGDCWGSPFLTCRLGCN